MLHLLTRGFAPVTIAARKSRPALRRSRQKNHGRMPGSTVPHVRLSTVPPMGRKPREITKRENREKKEHSFGVTRRLPPTRPGRSQPRPSMLASWSGRKASPPSAG